jgi:hypothetical protein|nr:hypothetical protein [Kofleriaceae bacterium]
MRGVVALLVVATGCGRVGFADRSVVGDGAMGGDGGSGGGSGRDGAVTDVLAGCVLHLPMDEASWAGSGAVVDTCSGFDGTAGGGADVTTDPVRGTVGNFVGGTSCVDEPDVAIGCLPLSGPAQSLVGELDEVVIWNRALPATDVAAWYAQTLE